MLAKTSMGPTNTLDLDMLGPTTSQLPCSSKKFPNSISMFPLEKIIKLVTKLQWSKNRWGKPSRMCLIIGPNTGEASYIIKLFFCFSISLLVFGGQYCMLYPPTKHVVCMYSSIWFHCSSSCIIKICVTSINLHWNNNGNDGSYVEPLICYFYPT